MVRRWLIAVCALALVFMGGCSESDSVPTVASAAKTAVASAVTSVPSVAMPAAPAAEPSSATKIELANAAPTNSVAPSSQLPDVDDLFAPPKLVAPEATLEPEPQPEPITTEATTDKKPLPQLRLIGFVDVEGVRALLSVDGKLNVVNRGDVAEGMNIVAIAPPSITLKQGDDGEEIQIDLFEQAWHHKPQLDPNRRGPARGPKGLATPTVGASPIPVPPPQFPAPTAPPRIPNVGVPEID